MCQRVREQMWALSTRFLQRLEKVHRAPCASETHRRKAQVPLPHHTRRLAAGCQLSSGWRFGLCAGFSPAAASGDSERRGMRLQTPGSSQRRKTDPVDVEF
ncbi:uncharacterized protein LOC107056682 isoform X2 [Gallus gallus]|uniref:uncharacterized protein LOC121111382 isoform X2 n=1 Tax=Gallus gallus TaxID=9031 RepID=UPI001AEBA08F|nr:uncharacterized protein LOC121111382 isoform X2 [Gallus gallus]XP_040533515.2 uncharacterized protein LOC121113422 isoform X2 [Gallus gallus]XP_040533516.1 uncharacterized protein LOC121111385 isoform X2 [Gallus gallus]XP_046779437.1 uncharacterized protein LOC107056682 isoform X2 [Gallus gallus]